MKYIQGTIGLPLILSIDKWGNIKWYVDASFAVHTDMRSHTGGFMTMGTWGSYVQSIKQNLNTKSSNEANLVVVDDVLNIGPSCYNFHETTSVAPHIFMYCKDATKLSQENADLFHHFVLQLQYL